ncbi:MAG: carbohydrate ABC transporter substrate-binding protein [Deinococcus sp.]|nr:carbohydrate ABC transporter substrate-binding protein [Deinococcus sp.]
MQQRMYLRLGMLVATVVCLALAGTSARQATAITFWWWGEEEAPGLERWLNETVQLFEQENPQLRIELVRQTTEGLIPASQAAAAAQTGPDLQYYWPVAWFLEHMWNGFLVPLDDLIPEEVEHYAPVFRQYASWRGKTYGAPLYMIGNPWIYNKALFAQAGLDPDHPPGTWDELLAAGEKLRSAGIIPIAGGMKDQFFADFPWLVVQPETLDSVNQFFNTFLGLDGSQFTDPPYVAVWERLQELIERGFFPEDINSLDLYEGFDLFRQEKAAMAFPVQPLSVQWARELGADKVGIMLTPSFADGALGDTIQTATQYVAVPVWSRHPQEAAQFIKFMHRPERMLALDITAGALMGDDRMDTSQLFTPIEREMFELTLTRSAISVYYVAPPNITEWTWPNFGELINGTITPQQAAERAAQLNAQWRQLNPDTVANFIEWMRSFQAGP